jgi:hypothetical protein
LRLLSSTGFFAGIGEVKFQTLEGAARLCAKNPDCSVKKRKGQSVKTAPSACFRFDYRA